MVAKERFFKMHITKLTLLGLLLFVFFTIQKQIGIKKDFNIPSLFLNFSVDVSCDLINLKQSFLTLLKHSSVTFIELIVFFDPLDGFDHLSKLYLLSLLHQLHQHNLN